MLSHQRCHVLTSAGPLRREGHAQKPEHPARPSLEPKGQPIGAVNLKDVPPVTGDLEEDRIRCETAAKYNTISWHIASTALKVGR
jgi:hypothetical protein